MKKKIVKRKSLRKVARKSAVKKKSGWNWAHQVLHASIFATAASAIRAAIR